MSKPITEISIWSDHKGIYNDRLLHDTAETQVIKYCGSTKGRNDKLVGPGARFFEKPEGSKGYNYIGRVVSSTLLGQDDKGINEFCLVIQKAEPQCFRIKEEAAAVFGWKKGFYTGCGIIQHIIEK